MKKLFIDQQLQTQSNYDVISDDFHVDTIHHEVLTSSEKIKYH
jgi:hypothetical protein